MQLTLERSVLLKALGHVQGVVERRNTIPILSNVLLSVEGGALSITATDLDMEVVDQAAGRGSGQGATTVNAAMLYDVVRKLPPGADVALKDGSKGDGDPRLSVVAGRSRFNLPLLPSGDFPQMNAEGITHSFTVDSDALQTLIERTRFAISSEEVRYYLNGLYLHTVEVEGAHKLRVVATDGHRLALAEMPAPEGSEGMPAVIIPRKAVAQIAKLAEDGGERIHVQVGKTKVVFAFTTGGGDGETEGKGAGLTSKVIDGAFPDYTRVIPRDNPRTALLDTKVFAHAVDRVATISGEKSRSIKLSFETGKLTLQVRNMEAGQAVEELEVEYDGPALEIGFNARYLIDVCAQVKGDQLEMRLAEPASPVLAYDPADQSSRFVLMPLRV